MTEPVLCSIDDGVATIILNNPPLNLVTLELTRTFAELLDRLAKDPAVRVLLVTGAGERAFCAGSDIREIRDLTAPGAMVERKLVKENETYSKLDDFPKPTVAAIRGLALGGGLELAVCCDLLVVEEDARLGLPEIKLGWFPGSGGPVRVARRIGEGRAKEMMFLGDPIDAPTALAWGLVNRVVPRGEALKSATELARRLAAQANVALQLCKQAIDLTFDVTEDRAIEAALALSDKVFRTADAREGARAFFAKEPPRFVHG